MEARMRIFISTVMVAAVFAIGTAHADSPKPKESPTEVVVINFGKLETTYTIDGSAGPDVAIEGTLHVASQALLSGDGTPVGYQLRVILSDALAASVGSGESFRAVSASDGIPAECTPVACAPPFWVLTFRLVPDGAFQKPSLLFDVTLKTQYAPDGTLLTACVAGQEGCDIGTDTP
jgi:hypothetical protein